MFKHFLILLACTLAAYAATPADTVWEVRHAGSDSNGCGFSAANKGATGVDMTYGAGFGTTTFTSTLSGAGSATLTDSANGFLNTMLGDSVNIAGQGVYVITAFTSSSSISVTPNLLTFSATSGVVGGACFSPGYVAGLKVAQNNVWIKSDATYSITSATANIASGVVLDSTGGVTTANSKWIGYQTTRGDYGTPPILQASGIASVSIFKATSTEIQVGNIEVDGGGLTAIKDFEFPGASSYVKAYQLVAINCTNRCIDFQTITGGSLVRSLASGASAGDFAIFTVGVGTYWLLEARDNVVTNSAIGITSGETCTGCMAYRNSGTGGIGINLGNFGAGCINCVSAFNGKNYHILGAQGDSSLLVNSISYGTTSNNGISTDQVQDGTRLVNVAAESGAYSSTNLPNNISPVTLTANPFVDGTAVAGHNNFALNSTSGGGAALQNAGYPGTSPGGSVGYLDIGPIQHQGTGSATQTSSAVVH